MVLHRSLGDVEPVRDLLVGNALGEHHEDFAFPVGQRLNQVARGAQGASKRAGRYLWLYRSLAAKHAADCVELPKQFSRRADFSLCPAVPQIPCTPGSALPLALAGAASSAGYSVSRLIAGIDQPKDSALVQTSTGKRRAIQGSIRAGPQT